MPLAARYPGELWGRCNQPGIICCPSCIIALDKLAELGGERTFSRFHCISLIRAKTQRQRQLTSMRDIGLCCLYQVAIVSLGIDSREGMRGIELHQAVTCSANEAVAHLRKGRRR